MGWFTGGSRELKKAVPNIAYKVKEKRHIIFSKTRKDINDSVNANGQSFYVYF